jgi:hypothetical protein
MTSNVAVAQVLVVLKEAFEGPGVYFNDADGGLLPVLDAVSAADASRAVAGSSVAAHVGHTLFGVRATTLWLRKDPTQPDWSQGWAVKAVDAPEWDRLRADLRAAYAELRDTIESHAAGGAEPFGGAVGGVAHVVYHLGAIRQKLAVIRTGG